MEDQLSDKLEKRTEPLILKYPDEVVIAALQVTKHTEKAIGVSLADHLEMTLTNEILVYAKHRAGELAGRH